MISIINHLLIITFYCNLSDLPHDGPLCLSDKNRRDTDRQTDCKLRLDLKGRRGFQISHKIIFKKKHSLGQCGRSRA